MFGIPFTFGTSEAHIIDFKESIHGVSFYNCTFRRTWYDIKKDTKFDKIIFSMKEGTEEFSVIFEKNGISQEHKLSVLSDNFDVIPQL